MTTRAILIKYGEIALRGGNRKIHENILLGNIRKRLGDAAVSVRKDQGRFYAELHEDADAGRAVAGTARIFGVSGVCPCIKTENNDIGHIMELALAHVRENYPSGGTFKVVASRADKSYHMNSQELAAALGAYLASNIPELTVRMNEPEIRLHVEIRSSVYIYSQAVKGAGGLPSGTGGKAVLLLSGGFDSPVAGYMAARRGAELVCVYFHSPPYTSEKAKEKAADLAKVLASYTGGIKLYIANFTDIQLFLNEKVPEVKLTLFLKRAMLKTASIIAAKEKAQALVTGDSIGQVASQTLHALAATDGAAEFPVLRPLAAMDKLDIMKIAEKIGTHDISARPYIDCCTVFVPKHPETKPKRSIIENMERRLGELPELIALCADNAEILEIM